MKLLTASQMREVDRRTTMEIGIPGTTLMENAGIAVVQVLEEEFEKLDSFHIGVICGRGNNGGDGFVIARHLFLRGITSHVYVIGGADGITGDARINLDIIRNYRDIPIAEITDETGVESLRQDLQSFHLIVDALLGTGLNQPVEGLLADVIRAVNDSSATVAAVDLPSGLFADEYRPVETAVFADLTVTFTAPKPGLILGDAGTYTGDLYTVSIGTPVIEATILLQDADGRAFNGRNPRLLAGRDDQRTVLGEHPLTLADRRLDERAGAEIPMLFSVCNEALI